MFSTLIFTKYFHRQLKTMRIQIIQIQWSNATETFAAHLITTLKQLPQTSHTIDTRLQFIMEKEHLAV